MRTSIASIFLLPIAALQIPSIFAPFFEPQLLSLVSNETLIPTEHELFKRDGDCATDYNSCSTLSAAYGGACCTVGSVCTTDGAKNIACCPTGQSCTGTVGTTAGTQTTTATGTITAAASVVSNSYFPFPYIQQTYSNSAACLSAYSDCQLNFAACTNDLNGGSYGVTIVVPDGAGVTVAPTAQNLGTASASSICSSLSAEACFDIQSSSCGVFGTATTSGASFIVGATTTGAAARPTFNCIAAAGVALGVVGQLI